MTAIANSYGNAYSGGICGRNYCPNNTPFRNCYNTGSISSALSGLIYNSCYATTGGICGISTGLVENCYNTGEINAFKYAGGICGWALGSSPIRNCYNTGDISTSSDFSGAGGICGNADVSVINCYNAGNISALSYYSNVGGICGNSSGPIFIRNCFNIGDVSSANSIASSAGGICGYVSGRNYGYDPGSDDEWKANPNSQYKDTFSLTDCYNTGNVSASDVGLSKYAEYFGTVEYFGAAGGIIGKISSYRSIFISNCYNTGNLSAFDEGGIYSEIIDNIRDISVSGCYWNIDSLQTVNGVLLTNKDKKGMAKAPGDIDGTAPLSTVQMKDNINASNNYDGFDFDTVWRFQQGANDSYPVFRTYTSVTVKIDGEIIYFPDQQPVIKNSRTIVPIYGVFEQLGYDVDWEQTTRTVTLTNDEYTIVLNIGDYIFTVNGNSFNFDVPAQFIGNRVMIPLRLILESVGCFVEWDGDSAIVIVNTV